MIIQIKKLPCFLLFIVCLQANAYCPIEKFNRQLIEETRDGLFLIQDFYKTGEKRSDPFLIKEENEARKQEYWTGPCGAFDRLTVSGEYTLYYKNGSKILSGYYENGFRKGLWLGWEFSGEKSYEKNYEESYKKLVGISIYWIGNIRGEGKESYRYQEDWDNSYSTYEVSDWHYYNENNKLMYEGKYSDGKKDGWWYGYCEGQVHLKFKFQKGKILEYHHLLTKEEMIKKQCSNWLRI